MDCAQVVEPTDAQSARRLAAVASARADEMVTWQAIRTPTAIAVEASDASLSYQEVESWAEAIAAKLGLMGVRPGDRVGLCLERTAHLPSALLGVLKTGAMYLPLDPAYPAARLTFMLEDAEPKVVVTTRALVHLLAGTRAQVLYIEDASQAVREPTYDCQVPILTDATPAYLIYTSGSTGQPKGVLVSHRALSNFLVSMQREPGVEACDRVLAITTLSFDIAVLELLLPLTVGARVILATQQQARDGTALARLIDQHQITLMQATPTTWHLLLESGWRVPLGFKALCGGEPMPPMLAARLLSERVELWNMYGPTETTVWSTADRISDASDITVGRPIRNTIVQIRDERQQLLATGDAGEICIGGDGVALGYWNRRELTEARFIVDPESPHTRVYRTGDLGRMRADGRIEHLGRLDFQVKVRGHRIELGEIESCMCQLPGVAQAVATVRQETSDDVRLIGYFVARAGHAVEANCLRESLERALPGYMVPHHLVGMPSFPLLPNGKIDRKALPIPSIAGIVSDVNERNVFTPTEAVIASIWRTLLKTAQVDADSDFFRLGGHSLLAVRMVTAVEQALGVNVPLSILLHKKTLSALAAHVTQQLALRQHGAYCSPSEWHSLVPLKSGQRLPLFCFHAVGGNVLNYRVLADALPEDQPVYALQSLGLDGVTLPLASINEMASRYIDEIRTIQSHGPYYLCGGSMGGTIAFEVAQQLAKAGEVIGLLAMMDTWGPDVRRARANNRRSSLGRILRIIVSGRWLSRIPQRLAARFQELRIENYRSRGQTLPQDLRWRAVRTANAIALARYIEEPYQGCLTLLCSRTSQAHGKPDLGWEGVVRGGVKVVAFDGEHNTFVEHPPVAQGLRLALLEAQAQFAPAQTRAIA